MHVIPLEGSYNARSVGSEKTPWLVRTASLDGLSAGGERTLRTLGVDLVIDLREPEEHGPRTHGLPVRSTPLYGEAPPAAGSLEGVYTGLVRDRGSRIAAAVGAIAEHPGVVAVHCTAGKDRTGLVVALARLVAGDDREAIVADYAHSGRTVRPARSGIATAQLDALALSGAERAAAERLHLDSPAEALESALELIDTFGGPETYLRTHGATDEQFRSLRARAARLLGAGTTA
ncbi:tyrosine-protein phosphatase [Leucobacter chromiireducens]|uniref:Tyrosine-protein phosphatase n=1 Tax=Leucobacter chromiireducens subsp. chromiireducens TaxID=660067 RepID=A0ABS1SNS3_9MICO|nr:tyrosine-protein phosphatase [Leucobacter chromiireducens subsp. chromiireducens]